LALPAPGDEAGRLRPPESPAEFPDRKDQEVTTVHPPGGRSLNASARAARGTPWIQLWLGVAGRGPPSEPIPGKRRGGSSGCVPGAECCFRLGRAEEASSPERS